MVIYSLPEDNIYMLYIILIPEDNIHLLVYVYPPLSRGQYSYIGFIPFQKQFSYAGIPLSYF
jgi:hypothetical protein